MNQQSIASIEIKYYSIASASMEFVSIVNKTERSNMQLLLLSILNFIHVVYSLDADELILEITQEVQSINNKLKKGNPIDIHFLRKYENILKKPSSVIKEFIKIDLVEKENTIYLETDTRKGLPNEYRYFSIFLLFESILQMNDKDLTKVLIESIDYVLSKDKAKQTRDKVELLITQSQYFTELFRKFILD